MSNQKSTCHQKNGKSSSSYPDAVQEFLDRKNKNREEFNKMGHNLSFREKWPGHTSEIPIVVDDDGNMLGNFCSYCHKYVEGANPWKNGAYVFTCCQDCLKSIGAIEDFLSNRGDGPLRTRRSMVDPETVNVEWEKFEQLVTKKSAKLSLLAKKHRIYTSEMKDIIYQKYGDRVVFKRGRYGGIFWSEEKKG